MYVLVWRRRRIRLGGRVVRGNRLYLSCLASSREYKGRRKETNAMQGKLQKLEIGEEGTQLWILSRIRSKGEVNRLYKSARPKNGRLVFPPDDLSEKHESNIWCQWRDVYTLCTSCFSSLANFLVLNRRRGDAHKPDGKTVHTFGTSLQRHQILLSCFSLKSSDFHAHSVDRVEGGRKKRMTGEEDGRRIRRNGLWRATHFQLGAWWTCPTHS